MDDMSFQNQQILDQQLHEQIRLQQQMDNYIHSDFVFQQTQHSAFQSNHSESVSIKNISESKHINLQKLGSKRIPANHTNEKHSNLISDYYSDLKPDNHSKKVFLYLLGITLITVIGIIIAAVLYINYIT